jgi:hypothetical protein
MHNNLDQYSRTASGCPAHTAALNGCHIEVGQKERR